LTQSAEKFKARLDRERLIKSFEKVQLYAEDESLSLTYSQLSELYEEIKMIVEIAQKVLIRFFFKRKLIFSVRGHGKSSSSRDLI
jgi:hypothetical protein